MKVLLAERRLSAALELTARVACSSVGASPATWVDGPAPAGARVLLAELQPGERQIPRELCDLLADAPTLHLMLCAQEPLVSPRVVLADGRVSLLAPPVDHAQLVEALQAVVGPPPPPPSSERGARYERLRRSHWLAWTRGVAAPAPRVEDRAGVLVMLGEAGEDFPGVAAAIARRDFAAAIAAAAGAAGFVSLTPDAQRWEVYWPDLEQPLWLLSPHRIPSRWRPPTAARDGLLRLRAFAGDQLVAAWSTAAVGDVERALRTAGPDTLAALDELAAAAPRFAAAVVEVR